MIKEIRMNVYEFAMQMEQDGESFYRDMATQSPHSGVTRILTMLADDEVKHYNIVKALSEKKSPTMTRTTILDDAKNVFAGIKDLSFDFEGAQVDLYKQAQEIEQRSQDFYNEKATLVTDPDARKILLQIADEERRHYFLLDHMIEFMYRPTNWVEDAEFTHLDTY
ncbi:MAG: rubrerythrin [Anaerolineales bacterium]|nr:MAG: rubrerythrin [Anaerolineales bacterium]